MMVFIGNSTFCEEFESLYSIIAKRVVYEWKKGGAAAGAKKTQMPLCENVVRQGNEFSDLRG
jgi:hypothetical protein